MQRSIKKSFVAWIKRPTTISMLVTFVLTLAIMLTNRYGFFESHAVQIRFMHQPFIDYTGIVPIMLFASLNGYIPAFVLSLIIFIFTSVQVGDFAFVTFVIMAAVMCTIQPTYNYWYRSKGKTALTILYFTLILGNGWGLIIDFVRGMHLQPWELLIQFMSALSPCSFVALFCYVFFNCAPDRIRNLFSAGIYYSRDCEMLVHQLAVSKHSKLKRHLTVIIVVEALALSVAAAIFADVMINQFIGFNRHFSPEFVRFGWRDWLSLDLKMVLLLMNVSVPILFFANSHAQKSIANPIILMKQAMDDFTEDTVSTESKSVLDIHLLPIHTGDEIEDLHKSLKKTVRNISLYIEELQREKQLEDDLKIARAANKAKSTFLSNMSHEIRTPINAVLGFDEMILREATDPVIIDYAEDIHNSSKTLLSLVNDILDFSKIEAGKMEIIPVQYELASAINDLVNMVQKRADDKQLTFTVQVDPTIPHLLFGDEVRFKQCVLNILTNAVKYTHQGGFTLSVTHAKKDEHTIALTVRVTDTGIGIKKEDIAKLFTAFERIEEKRNRAIEGTGLGMNIVQQLLGMMGSRLEVTSEYGKGSDFSFTLDQGVVNWEPMGAFEQAHKKAMSEAMNTYQETFTAPDACILVVDDTPLNIKVVKGLLKQTQIQIDEAESGQVTLELVQKKRYDLILLDHRMPGMDGIETLEKMHGLPNNLNAGVPVVALTANAVGGAREMYLDAGFTDYLSKPIDYKKLERMLRKYLPAEKVRMTLAREDTAGTSPGAGDAAAAEFPAMDGVNVAAALQNCGSADILKEAFQDFYANIDTKSAQIADFAARGDWKNYTVLVHALKSSARLIGAAQLSEDAKYLEACGDLAGNAARVAAAGTAEENERVRSAMAAIAEKTPALLALYRSYKTRLAPVVQTSADNADKTEMDEAAFDQALSALKECVSAFDFNTADQIVQQVNQYAIPAARAEQWKTVTQAISNVDQAAVMAAL